MISVTTTSKLVNRDFTATGPHQQWVADIIEHPA
jgi:hypothetical protein